MKLRAVLRKITCRIRRPCKPLMIARSARMPPPGYRFSPSKSLGSCLGQRRPTRSLCRSPGSRAPCPAAFGERSLRTEFDFELAARYWRSNSCSRHRRRYFLTWRCAAACPAPHCRCRVVGREVRSSPPLAWIASSARWDAAQAEAAGADRLPSVSRRQARFRRRKGFSCILAPLARPADRRRPMARSRRLRDRAGERSHPGAASRRPCRRRCAGAPAISALIVQLPALERLEIAQLSECGFGGPSSSLNTLRTSDQHDDRSLPRSILIRLLAPRPPCRSRRCHLALGHQPLLPAGLT